MTTRCNDNDPWHERKRQVNTMTEVTIGQRLRLLQMPEDPNPVPPGTMGTVLWINRFAEWTQIGMRWDNGPHGEGRTLALAVPPDRFEIETVGWPEIIEFQNSIPGQRIKGRDE